MTVTQLAPAERSAGEAASVAEIVAAAAQGESSAWQSLLERFGGRIRAIAVSYGLGAADVADVSQIVWLRLLDHVDRLQDPERVGAWLATTTRNECLQVLKRRRRVIPTSDVAVLDEVHAADPLADLALRAEREMLARLIQTLPSPQQSLVRMLLLDPAPSYESISSVLGMPVGSIGPTRQRCVSALSTRFNQAGHKERG